jgi:hypothetical protein
MSIDINELKTTDVGKLHTAKNEELKEMAEVLKIEYDPEAFVRQEMIAKIKEAVIEVQTDGRIRRVIFHNSGEGTASTVTIGVNGKLLEFPKDVPVYIPESFLSVIDDAVEYRTEMMGSQRVTRRFMSQTYQVLE